MEFALVLHTHDVEDHPTAQAVAGTMMCEQMIAPIRKVLKTYVNTNLFSKTYSVKQKKN